MHDLSDGCETWSAAMDEKLGKTVFENGVLSKYLV
jgi:hypothetical protein